MLREAEREENDLINALEQVDEKIIELNCELKAAERRKLEDEFRGLGVERFSIAPKMDAHVAATVKLIEEVLRISMRMHDLATKLGIEPKHFDAESSLASFFHCTLAPVLPHGDFVGMRTDVRQHYAKKWSEIERVLLGGYLERYGIGLPKEETERATAS